MISKNKKISNGMKRPNFNEEKKLWRKGYKYVVGIDESGRGPLAGPVVATAVIVRQVSAVNSFGPKKLLEKWQIQGIKDSKKLSPKKRKEFFNFLAANSNIEWGTGKVSEKIIDRINILEAAKLAMGKAIGDLEKKLKKKIEFLIIDGNFAINSDIPQKSIIKADEKVFSCVAAGIIAKVVRDKIMLRYDKKYPEYGFAKHKGYGTKLHQETLKKYGPCEIYRKTFRPVLERLKIKD